MRYGKADTSAFFHLHKTLFEEETAMGDALGLIETKGLVACIEAADAMCKAANVELIGYENVGSGLVTAMVKGDVGAVKAAVDSGVESAQRIGEVVTSLVIARPHNDINKIVIKHKA
jgi:microcompartment protein CcmL/EutN